MMASPCGRLVLAGGPLSFFGLRYRNLSSSYDYTILPFHIQASEAMNPEDDMDMPMSGDGEASENKADMEPPKDEKRTYQKPLKIRGSFDDALRVIVGKPRAEK